MISLHQANGFGLRADLQDLGRAFEFDVFDHGHHVAVREDVAVGIFHHPVCRGINLVAGVFRPFVAAGHTFKVLSVIKHIVHFTKGACGLVHGSRRGQWSGW